MHVIGTAGHVDHGKTTLLRLLTGMEPSRLPEERRRGMSMQLGYVWLAGPNGKPIGIIDLPGHADFRSAMVAGASAIDAFLFVCACDDGWMPQSEEHLFALKTFGICRGLVVLTKTDLVSEERIQDLKAELEVRFYEALGQEIAVVPFSATKGRDFDQLRLPLNQMLASLPKPEGSGRAEMYVDRSFSVLGQGTVVTGTLREGRLTLKQRVELLPQGKTANIRAMEAYGKGISVAEPNTRLAIQLVDVSPADVPRGTQIAPVNCAALTNKFDLRISPYLGYQIRRQKSPRVTLAHGGVLSHGHLIFIGQEGTDYICRMSLEEERWIRFGEPVLLVSSGGDLTLGGGRVIDECAYSSVRKVLPRLLQVREFTLQTYLTANIQKLGWLDQRSIWRRTRFRNESLQDTLADAECICIGNYISTPARIRVWHDAIIEKLAYFHANFPDAEGPTVQQLASPLKLPEDLAKSLLQELVAKRIMLQIGSAYKLPTHEPSLDDKDEFVQFVRKKVREKADAALSYFDLGIDTEKKRRVLARFLRARELVRLDETHVLSALVFDDLSRRVQRQMLELGHVSVAQVRDALGLGRKFIVQLLEAMDEQGLTIRDGEGRRLLKVRQPS